MREEKQFNPRVGGSSAAKADFVGFLENLGLPHPKQMDVAVPANLKCGHVAAADVALGAAWAPLRYTYAGINEIDPQWVAEHVRRPAIIDVREPREYAGELGHIRDAHLIPLGTLARSLRDSSTKTTPTVTVCRSGGRSAQAVVILEKAGFTKTANLAGGMLSWNEHRLPVQR